MTLIEEAKSPLVMSQNGTIDSLLNGKRQLGLDEHTRKKAKISEPESDNAPPEIIELKDDDEQEKQADSQCEAQTEVPQLSSPPSQADEAPNSEKLHPSESPSTTQEVEMSNNVLATPEPFQTDNAKTKAEILNRSASVTPSQGESTLTEKQLQRLQKQKQREEERLQREKKKEEERLMKKLERERKDQERLLKKRRLEEEKERKREEERQRREEKRRKAEDEKKRKEEERKKKEDEKKRKEEERKRLEEEKKKQQEQKERNQMKISSFFSMKPSKPEQATTKPATENKQGIVKEEEVPYTKQFLPFFVKKNAVMAPTQALTKSDLEALVSRLDSQLMSSDSLNFEQIFSPATSTSRRSFTTVEQLVEAFDSTSIKESDISSMLNDLPRIRYLQFYENAKPPYIGTWCSKKHLATHFDVTNPLDVSKTGYDYDYDSDLDWQDGDDEGEDIDDLEDGEGDEEDLNDEEDMEDFVEQNAENRKKLAAGPLEPVTIINDGSNPALFSKLSYTILAPFTEFPINPYKDYWGTEDAKLETATPQKPEAGTFSVNQLKDTPVNVKTTGSIASPNVLTPQKPTIKDKKVIQDLIAFIEKNSDFTIGTLSELAKKEFKNFTKSILKHTIQEIATYNKKQNVWEIKEGVKENS